jgi:hypothetical protein
MGEDIYIMCTWQVCPKYKSDSLGQQDRGPNGRRQLLCQLINRIGSLSLSLCCWSPKQARKRERYNLPHPRRNPYNRETLDTFLSCLCTFVIRAVRCWTAFISPWCVCVRHWFRQAWKHEYILRVVLTSSGRPCRSGRHKPTHFRPSTGEDWKANSWLNHVHIHRVNDTDHWRTITGREGGFLGTLGL